MSNRPPPVVVLLLAVALSCDGVCYDLDSVPFAALDGGIDVAADDGLDGLDTDVPDDTDVADDADAPDDLGDLGDLADMADAPPDMGPTCVFEHPVNPDRCNPTESGKCPGAGFCTLALSGAPPPELNCVSRDKEGTGGDGADCAGPADCLEGYTCVDWSLNDPDPRSKGCAKFCEIDTNVGCAANEFCTTSGSLPPMEGIGVCAPSCDPYDADACETGGTCNVDFNYPPGTCLPHFRCVESTDSKGEGDECGPARRVSECGAGLVCYEVEVADFRCVRPCQAAGDCAATGNCSEPTGDWALRYCELS